MPSKRYLQTIARATKANGWSASKTGGGHIKLTHPDATTPVFASSTSSDHRANANLEATMRRVLKPAAADAAPSPPPPKPAESVIRLPSIIAPASAPAQAELQGLRGQLDAETHRRQLAEANAQHLAEALESERAKVAKLEREARDFRTLRGLLKSIMDRDYDRELALHAAAPVSPPSPPPPPPPPAISAAVAQKLPLLKSPQVGTDNAGKMLAAHRRITGDSQTIAGQRIGVSVMTVSSWERGCTRPKGDKLDAVRAYLSTSVVPPVRGNGAAHVAGRA